MDNLHYTAPTVPDKSIPCLNGKVVPDALPYRALDLGQVELLKHLPRPTATIGLDAALDIVGRHHASPFVQIIVLMNRKILGADFGTGDGLDQDIVLRRL